MADSIEVSTPEYKCERRDDLAVITMEAKGFRIATDRESKERFTQLLSAIEESTSIRGLALINTSEYPGEESYRSFLESITRREGLSAHGARKLVSLHGNALSQLALRVSEFPKPIVAGLSGRLSGDDLGMVLPCDFRLATPDVSVMFSNIKLGFPPSGVLVYYLLRFLGPARATEILYSPSPLEAKNALSMGLLSRIVDENELEKQCINQLELLATLPTEAVAATRHMIQPDPLELRRYLDRSLEMRWLALSAMKIDE